MSEANTWLSITSGKAPHCTYRPATPLFRESYRNHFMKWKCFVSHHRSDTDSMLGLQRDNDRDHAHQRCIHDRFSYGTVFALSIENSFNSRDGNTYDLEAVNSVIIFDGKDLRAWWWMKGLKKINTGGLDVIDKRCHGGVKLLRKSWSLQERSWLCNIPSLVESEGPQNQNISLNYDIFHNIIHALEH